MKKIAGIDIGSNTVLMLISELTDDGTLRVVREENAIARLGEGVNETKMLNDNAIARACDILKRYKAVCDEEKVDIILPVATSASRDAKNSDKAMQQFKEILGAEAKVISGEEEARLTFLGTMENAAYCTVLDIGGGSTEFISGRGGKIEYKKSINIGAVRVKEMFFPQHPPTSEQIAQAREFIIENLQKIDRSNISNLWYAVAGSPTSVAAVHLGLREFDYDRIHLFPLEKSIIESVWEIILSHSVDEIVNKYGMHPKRADIISAGVLILKTSLEFFGYPECKVSVKGLRYGIVKDRAVKEM